MADHTHSGGAHESFLQRWARRKEEAARAGEDAAPSQARTVADISDRATHALAREGERTPAHARVGARSGTSDELVASSVAPLTSDDVAALAADANYAPFMASGVDKSVQRLAMKKLFTDPHFQVLDGLDIYMGDYNVASPVSAGMLAGLQHAQGMLARGAELAERLAEAERAALAAGAPSSANSGTMSVAASGVAPVPPPISEGDA